MNGGRERGKGRKEEVAGNGTRRESERVSERGRIEQRSTREMKGVGREGEGGGERGKQARRGSEEGSEQAIKRTSEEDREGWRVKG